MAASRTTLVLILLSLAASGASAQVTDTTGRTKRGGAPGAPGAAGAPGVPDSTDRYNELQARAAMRVPVAPRLAADGPQPARSRLVFDRESIEWTSALTVGDLLGRVPGVFLWRAGRLGRPEPANFRGRGAASVEYYLDGMPYLAVGPDSLSVDPALFALSFFDRIEAERWPGVLRVRLYTRRHDRLAPRSRIGLGSGQDGLKMYQAELETRSASGFGLGVAADYLKAPVAAGTSGAYQNTQFWVQGSYVRSPRFGVQYQLMRSDPDRDVFSPVAGGASLDRLEGRRSDMQARLFLGSGADASGPRLDLVYARTGWDSAGIDQQVNQLGGFASLRSPIMSARAGAFYRTRWTPLDASASFSITPASALTLALDGAYQTHDGGRSSRWVGARVGVALPAGLTVGASARTGRAVPIPSLAADTAQGIGELEGTVGWDLGWIAAEGAYTRTGAFAPAAFQPYAPVVAAIAPSGGTEWMTLSGRLSPFNWLSLEGWLSHPRNAPPEGLPPRHFAATGTIRSKFLRAFPSGAFDLKLELGIEGWGNGTLGRDPFGAPVFLPSETFLRSLVQLQLQSFTVFWDSRNIGGAPGAWVPGFRPARYSGAFGIRWQFSN